MSKEKLPKDILSEIAYGPTKGTQGGHKEDTAGTQKGHMKIYKVRFQEEDWQALKQHFKNKGIPVSTGIRGIVKDYLNDQGM